MSKGKTTNVFYYVTADFGKVERGGWRPNMDVYETAEEVVVSLELPGVKAEDISVTVHGDKLKIRGVRRHECYAAAVHFHQIETACGEFERELVLSGALFGAPVEATLALGILSLRISKSRDTRGEAELTIPIEAQ